jgi:hypothetical protein
MAFQIVSQLAKTFMTPSTWFFPEGGEDLGRVLSKPETATSLHPKEVIVVEEEVVEFVETESIKICPGGMDGRGGGCSQRGPIKDIFAAVVCFRNGIFSNKRNDAKIHEQTPSRKILEKIFNSRSLKGTKRRWRLWT